MTALILTRWAGRAGRVWLSASLLLAAAVTPAPITAAQQATPAAADPSPYTIRFKSRTFTPEPGFAELASLMTAAASPQTGAPQAAVGDHTLYLPLIFRSRGAPPPDLTHLLVQFYTLPDAAVRGELARYGFELLSYATGNAYIVSGSAAQVPQLQTITAIRWAGPLQAGDKIEPALAAGNAGAWARLPDGREALTIQFHPDITLAEGEAVVRRLGGEVIGLAPGVPSILAAFAPGQATRIAQEDHVQYVAAREPSLSEMNDGAAPAANVTPLRAAPYSLNGTGVTVLVYDSGILDNGHPDFAGRVLQTEAGENVRQHSTHVSGSAAGSGANSNGNDSIGNANGGTPNQWMGSAPAANIRSFGSPGSANPFYDDTGDINANFTTALGNGTDLATMSLGNNVVLNGFPCGQLGDYANAAILLDQIVRGSIAGQQLIYFESAGNERQGGAPCGQFSTIGSPATAKNTIAVGAINSNDNSMTGFSSFGPTDDGRLKPDIVGPGCQNGGDGGITSPAFDDADGDGNLDAGETRNSYVVMCGTSMSTPIVAGATALLIQQWRTTRGAGSRPLPHTVKALYAHTATDLGNAGPDYRFGWGAFNARAAVDLVRADDTADLIHVEDVGNGATDFFTFNSDGSGPVRVTLAWSDPPATRLAATTLINNLDLRLVDPDGIVFQPFLLNPAAPGNVATNGDDNVNVVEMVIGAAKAGTWTVRVIGDAVPSGPQVYTLITPTDGSPDNRPPLAEAGGPYVTSEGTNVALSAAGSSDPDGDPLVCDWDMDNNGTFEVLNNCAPAFDRVGQDGSFTVRLRVTDPDGAFDTDTASVTVANAAPDLTLGSLPADENSPLTVNGVVSDPGWLDPLSATIDWGDGSPVQPIAGMLENVRPDATFTFNVPHTYGDNGVYGIRVCGQDDDVTVCENTAVFVENADPSAALDKSGAVLIGGVLTLITNVGDSVTFHADATDPGSDDLHFSWDWIADEFVLFPNVVSTSLVNPPSPDPYLSPSIQPRAVSDEQTRLMYTPCHFVITLRVSDDDAGEGTDSLDVIITGTSAHALSAAEWLERFRAGAADDTLNGQLGVVRHMSAAFRTLTMTDATRILAAEGAPRELLAAWLNFASGAIGYTDAVDTDGDGLGDTPFAQVMAQAEAGSGDAVAALARLSR